MKCWLCIRPWSQPGGKGIQEEWTKSVVWARRQTRREHVQLAKCKGFDIGTRPTCYKNTRTLLPKGLMMVPWRKCHLELYLRSSQEDSVEVSTCSQSLWSTLSFLQHPCLHGSQKSWQLYLISPLGQNSGKGVIYFGLLWKYLSYWMKGLINPIQYALTLEKEILWALFTKNVHQLSVCILDIFSITFVLHVHVQNASFLKSQMRVSGTYPIELRPLHLPLQQFLDALVAEKKGGAISFFCLVKLPWGHYLPSLYVKIKHSNVNCPRLFFYIKRSAYSWSWMAWNTTKPALRCKVEPRVPPFLGGICSFTKRMDDTDLVCVMPEKYGLQGRKKALF